MLEGTRNRLVGSGHGESGHDSAAARPRVALHAKGPRARVVSDDRLRRSARVDEGGDDSGIDGVEKTKLLTTSVEIKTNS